MKLKPRGCSRPITTADANAALLRLDFGYFLRFAFHELGGLATYSHNWHIDAILYQLERIREGENTRLTVTIPPRHLKSRIISIAWVAWMWGHNPALSFLCVSYGQELSEDHAIDCLKIIESDWYRAAFPSLVLTSRAIDHIRTSAGGRRLATSIDGKTTGLGADIVIIDDPMKTQDTLSQSARAKVLRWFDQTLSQRLNNQLTGSVIVVMQRLHEDDLVGEIKRRGGWHELSLPAIATEDEAIPVSKDLCYKRRAGSALHPARQPLSLLLERKAANPWVFASQFQQQPVSEFGNIIEAGWINRFDLSSLDLSLGQIVISADTATKDNPFNDWTVFVIARVLGKSVHIIDVFRARLIFPDLLAKTIELARLHRAGVLLIEDAASGQSLIQSLRRDEPSGVPLPIARRPEGDKITRLMAVSAMVQAGRLFLPENAHWVAEFTGEVLGFPGSKHDDQVDALAQLLAWVQDKDLYRADTLAGPEIVEDDDRPEGLGHIPPAGSAGNDKSDPWL